MNFRQDVSYIVAFDNPALISNERIRKEAKAQGFDIAAMQPCEDMVGFPFALPTACNSDWDWFVVVTRVGPDRLIDMPDRVAWVIEIPAKQLPAPKPWKPGEVPPPPPPAAQPTVVYQKQPGKVDRRRAVHMTAEAAGIFVALPVGWWASSKIKHRNARYALRAVLITMATVDALLLYAYLRE